MGNSTAGVGLFLLICAQSLVALAGDWPQLQLDPAHTGYTPDQPNPPFTLFRRRDLGEPIQPAQQPIVADGERFTGTQWGHFYALGVTTGSRRWVSPQLHGMAMRDYWLAASDTKILATAQLVTNSHAVAHMLGDWARPSCRTYLDNLDKSAPLWYLSEAPTQSATEQRLSPPQLHNGNVLAMYWILKKRGDSFARYVDATRFKGDLYHIQNVTALLQSYTTRKWTALHCS